MMGAKKFTRNTCCQTSSAVSIEESRLPPSALGEIAALLTSACNSPFSSRCLISEIAAVRVAGLGEIDLDVIFRSHLPRAVFRERVARAGDHPPAGRREALDGGVADAAACSGEQKRAARLVRMRRRHEGPSPRRPGVAKTNPGRFAAISPLSFRGPSAAREPGIHDCGFRARADARPGMTADRPHASSRVEPRLAPRCASVLAAELDAVVQPVGPILPEFHRQRQQTIARPVRRPWNRSNGEFRRRERDRLLEGEAAFERRRLLARPGADLRQARTGGEISISLGIRSRARPGRAAAPAG